MLSLLVSNPVFHNALLLMWYFTLQIYGSPSILRECLKSLRQPLIDKTRQQNWFLGCQEADISYAGRKTSVSFVVSGIVTF